MRREETGTRFVRRLARPGDVTSERAFCGVHLRLPGCGDDGPTLEIFSYEEMVEGQMPTANECGFAHIAFAVDDVDQALEATIAAGGSTVGDIATTQVDGVGVLRVVYARDPEGNIVELQKWS